ncbi:MAG: monofunctional biosynthetic peptidoglycan transglycosylase [Elusimicrobia bacterium]|nr:monofunctional biosynthetic peptidoglycan transglycosylase [Elusimicrobiota bacterium]
MRVFSRRLLAAIIALDAAVLAVVILYWVWVPDVSHLKSENLKTTAYIEQFVRRSRRLGKRPLVMMRWRPLEAFSPHLRHAVIIAEDDMFYRHGGVDWDAVRQALRYDWERGKVLRGGSTITQQLARNLYLSPARTPGRKLRETLIAWELERKLSKDRILELYLNIAEWGVGIYGAQAASEIYFGKSASDLTPEEAVSLASALPSPWRLNPLSGAGPRLDRRKEVLLGRMRRAGYLPPEIGEEEVELSAEIDIPSSTGGKKTPPLPAAPLPDEGAPLEITENEPGR